MEGKGQFVNEFALDISLLMEGSNYGSKITFSSSPTKGIAVAQFKSAHRGW
jgi:hypothetical protein